MAKRVGAAKAGAAKAGGDEAGRVDDAEGRLVDAALRLAAQQGWRRIGVAAVAAEAGLPLDQAYAACPSKVAILAAFHRRIDRAALAGPAIESDASARDRLFDIMMRRFDALRPHRAALGAILRDSIGDPSTLLDAPAVLRSMVWMLEGAGVLAAGWRGGLRTQLLAGLYFWVLRDFLDDDSADLAKTMAALDRRLRRAQSLLGIAGPVSGGAGAGPGRP
jgi:AcrR family transcriptional regulator